MTGRWDEAVEIFAEFPEGELQTGNLASVLTGILEIFLHRGEPRRARELLSQFAFLEDEIALQDRAIYKSARSAVLYAEGALSEALADGAEAAAIWAVTQAVKQGLVWAVESALALGDDGRADELLRTVEERAPGLRPPFLEAQAQRFRARLTGDVESFKAAAAGFREYGIPFWLAVTLLEHGDLTGDQALLSEAREIFEGLGATPWLERLDAMAARGGTGVPA